MEYTNKYGEKERVGIPQGKGIKAELINNEIVITKNKPKDATDSPLEQLFKHDINPTK